MHITITSSHILVEENTKKYIEKKLQKVQKIVSEKDTLSEAHVEISKDTNHHQKGEMYKVEINIHTKGKTHRADALKDSVQKSFDLAYKVILEELKTHYQRKNRLFKKGAQKIKDILRR